MSESDEGTAEQAASAASDALRRATRSTAPRKSSPQRPTVRPSTSGRDPQLVSQALDDLLAQRGWQDDSAIAVLMTRWPQIVGDDLAGHVTPVTFEEGVLTLQAESTAWATQVRLLLPDLQRVVDGEVGKGVVTSLRVVGPAAPSWSKGPRRVKGRGPRDTYG